MPLRLWQDMTTVDIRASDVTRWIAVQPVAAVEQHGPHLPLSTDSDIAAGAVARTIGLLPADLPATFLPIQTIGKSDEHQSFPGTLSLSATTLRSVLTEIGESAHRSGLRKLVLVSSHGGNSPVLDIVAGELRSSLGMLVVTTSWRRFGYPDRLFSNDEIALGIHGGDIETSLMLHLRPDAVRRDLALDFPSGQAALADRFRHLRAYGSHQFGWRTEDLNADGAVGNASAATAAKGKAVLDYQAARFVELLQEVAAFDLPALHH
ncbi:MAG: creatininase family protein [Bauldia sp.]